MSLSGFLVRFTLIYAVLLLVICVLPALLDFDSGLLGAWAALFGAVMWACLWFARSTKRYFKPVEKRNAVLGMLAIQGLPSIASALLAGNREGLHFAEILFGLVFAVVVEAAAIWFLVGLSGRKFAKEAANGG